MSRRIQKRLMRSMIDVALVAVVSAIPALCLVADEFYVPRSSSPGALFVTAVQIANRSENSMTVAIEMLSPLGSRGSSTHLTLAAGESTEWSDDDADQTGSYTVDALAIRADGPLAVTAIRRCAACGAISPVSVLDAHDLIREGAITLASTDSGWIRGVGVINPGAAAVLLIVSLHRGERVIEEASLYVPSGAARLVSIDDLFNAAATDPNDWVAFTAPQAVFLFGYTSNNRTGAAFFAPAEPAATSPRRRRAVRPGLPQPTLQTLVLTPSKDNTLYQTTNGSLSNGAGVHLFGGMNNRGERRRSLLAFDIASQIPPGSQITSAVLKLQVSQTSSGTESMELHGVSADWGQGSSNAGNSRDGDGTASRAGDATWVHTFFPDRSWSMAGADFNSAADASTPVGGGPVTWGSSAAMIARVQDWLDHPSTNFGWILIGNETSRQTAKRFDSREVIPGATRPALTVEFKK